jgi:hypothetical protein
MSEHHKLGYQCIPAHDCTVYVHAMPMSMVSVGSTAMLQPSPYILKNLHMPMTMNMTLHLLAAGAWLSLVT